LGFDFLGEQDKLLRQMRVKAGDVAQLSRAFPKERDFASQHHGALRLANAGPLTRSHELRGNTGP